MRFFWKFCDLKKNRKIYLKVSFWRSSSASSKTIISTPDPVKSPLENKSKILPGVPIKTCGLFFFKFLLSWTKEVPPIINWILTFSFDKLFNVWWPWRAISRVGVKTIAWIWSASSFIRSRTVIAKTSVFPVPDFD